MSKQGEFAHWPLCAVCSELYREPTVVEEYGTPPESALYKTDSAGTKHLVRLTVVAKCSHGRGFRPGTVREQKCQIDIPEWWGVAHVDDAIRSLIFFAPGEGAPNHKLVTQVNYMIKKEGEKYVLKTKDGKKTLGTHHSRKDAEAQEAAINISKAKRAGKK